MCQLWLGGGREQLFKPGSEGIRIPFQKDNFGSRVESRLEGDKARARNRRYLEQIRGVVMMG